MRVLYHLSEGPITEKLGHIMYRIPPGEPTEIADDFHAEKLLERLVAKGVRVAVHVPKGPIPTGMKGVDWADLWHLKDLAAA